MMSNSASRFCAACFLVSPALLPRAPGGVDHLGEDHRPRRRQGAARPPQMNAPGVRANPWHFFMGASGVDVV